ncbi:MAG TPA: DUF2267 domain-containing protein [Chryseolinea sp.]|nr:DUF2267 domain-containing protein [Chryseolinea sp.]
MFEQYEADANKFVSEVSHELGNEGNHQVSIRILTSVLHTIRDLLTVEGSLHLISQLPLLIKGIYVSGWHLGAKEKIKDKDQLIEQLLLQNTRTGPTDFGTDEKALNNLMAIIRVLQRHVSPGEISDIKAQFPLELKSLWTSGAPA